MSAKPTPGPYFVRPRDGGHAVEGIHGVTVGWFGRGSVVGRDGSHHISTDETEANARAWVDGMEAVEKLDMIRAAMNDKSWNDDAYDILKDVQRILDEDKP